MRRGRGFSLLEMSLVTTLMAILVGLAIGMSRSQTGKASSRSAAELLASLLRSSRQQAILTGMPVGVALPSQGQTLAVTDSCYQLTGFHQPKVTKVLRLAGEGCPAQMFAGQYAGPAWQASPPAGSPWSPWSPTWNTQGASDACVTFFPDGTLSSNLPLDQGEIRWVLGEHIQATPGSPPQLTSVSQPFTVSLSPLGAVRVQAGLENGAAGLVDPHSPASTLAGPLRLALGGNHPPTMQAPYLRAFPSAQNGTLPGVTNGTTCTTTIALDGVCTVEALASDPDGDRLYCRWSAQRSDDPSAPGGQFSQLAQSAMTWNSAENCWVSRWSWQPPPGAQVGQEYILNCEISDAHGATCNPSTVGVQLPRPQAISSRKMTFIEDGSANVTLWVSNFDGTDPRQLFSPTQMAEQGWMLPGLCIPQFSPDGRWIAFWADYPALPQRYHLMACRPDGSGLRLIGTNPDDNLGLAWHPSGLWLASLRDTGVADLAIDRYDFQDTPSAPVELARWTTTGFISRFLSFHPSGQCILTGGGVESYVVWQNGEVDLLPPMGEPTFAPSGNQIVFQEGGYRSEVLRTADITTFDPVGRTLTLAPSAPHPLAVAGRQSPVFSRDGQWMLGQDSSTTANLGIFLYRTSDNRYLPIDFSAIGISFDHAHLGP